RGIPRFPPGVRPATLRNASAMLAHDKRAVENRAIPTLRRAALDQLRGDILHAAEFLPAQGPINVFIHHNTLHAFEHLPFHEAVREGARLFGCQPYLSEQQYRLHLQRGRFCLDDVRAALAETLGPTADEPVAAMSTRFQLRM